MQPKTCASTPRPQADLQRPNEPDLRISIIVAPTDPSAVGGRRELSAVASIDGPAAL